MVTLNVLGVDFDGRLCFAIRRGPAENHCLFALGKLAFALQRAHINGQSLDGINGTHKNVGGC